MYITLLVQDVALSHYPFEILLFISHILAGFERSDYQLRPVKYDQPIFFFWNHIAGFHFSFALVYQMPDSL